MPITITLLAIFATTIITGFILDIAGMFYAIQFKNKQKKETSKFFFIMMTLGEWLIKFSFSLSYLIVIVAIIEFCVRFL